MDSKSANQSAYLDVFLQSFQKLGRVMPYCEPEGQLKSFRSPKMATKL